MQSEGISTKTTRSAPIIWRALLVCMLSLALVLVSFGHRPLQAEPQATAYILAGGDWADLCADGDDPHLLGDRCMACLVAHGIPLPDPASASPMAMLADDAHWSDTAKTLRALPVRSSHPARAPPLFDRSPFI